MKTFAFAALLAAAAFGSAAAQSPMSPAAAKRAATEVCLDVNGASLPIVCRIAGGMVDKEELICHCPRGRKVDAPICADGEQPLPENVRIYAARDAAAQDGTLIGDTFEGRRFCERPSR